MGSPNKHNSILLLATLLALSSCIPGVKGGKTNINVSSQVSKISVNSVQYKNNQIVIKGSNLSMVKKVSINGNATNQDLAIVSESASEIVAEAASAFKLTANVVYDLILADAWGQASFPLSFDLSDNTVSTTKIVNGAVTLPKITTTGANKGDTIRYNGTNWEFASISQSQVYMGTFNASNETVTTNGVVGLISGITPSAGDYYIVTVAGLYNNIQYNVGDWIISDGLSWQNIPAKNTTVVSFQGRQGVVTLDPADYTNLLNASKKLPGSNLKNIEDIDVVTTAPANGFVLGYNGTSKTWGPIDLSNLFQGKQDANNYVTALTGDVTASGPTGGGSAAATVAKVGGKDAATIANAVTDVQNATNANTVSTLVKRAANGAVAVGPLTATTITTSSNVNITGSLTATTLSGNLTGSNVSGDIAGKAANVTGTVAVINGGTGATTLPTNALLYGNGTSAVGALAAPTTAKVLLTNNVGVLGWQSSSTPGAILKSDSVNGAYFGTLTSSDLPSGTMTGTGSANYIPYYTSSSTMGSSPMFIAPSTSYVGINTTTPSSVLEVAGNPIFSGPNNVGSFLKFTDGNGINNYIGFDRAITPASTTTDFVMQSSGTSQSIKFKIGNTEKARIDGSTGNVGIGIAAPLYPLHVKSSAGSVATLESTSAAAMLGFIDSATTTRPQIGSSGNGLNFQTNGSGRMLIDSTGNVGIGMTAAAANKLDVNGQTNTTTLCIAGDCKSAWNMLSSNIQDGTIVNADINASAAIDATKINTGVVSNAEFNYLDGVTSSIQAQLDGKQPLDSTLTALAAYNSNGIMVQTAADTFTARTITGTANRLVVTNGSGVAGNPSLDVDTSLLPSPVAGDAGKYLKTSGANTSAWSTITGSDLTYTGGTFAFATASSVTVPSPVNLNDAVTKSYVDNQTFWIKDNTYNSGIYYTGGGIALGPTNALDGTISIQKSNNTNYFSFRDNSASAFLRFVMGSDSSGNQFIKTWNGASWRVDSETNSNIIYASSNGKVGIGTSNPTTTLQVGDIGMSTSGAVTQIDGSGKLLYLRSANQGSTTIPFSIMTEGPNYGGANNAYTDNNDAMVLSPWSSGSMVDMLFGVPSSETTSQVMKIARPTNTNYRLAFGTQATEVMSVLANGNVGIGTSTPQAQLNISNSGIWDLRLNGSPGGANISSSNSLQFLTNNHGTVGIHIATLGNVGIGTTSPNAKLEVAGAIVSTTNAVSAAAVDLSKSNTHTLSSVGGSTITLSNMVDGGTYTLVITDTTARTYTFSGCTTSYFRPANAATTASTRTIYGILTIKNGANWDCYINWTSGYQ